MNSNHRRFKLPHWFKSRNGKRRLKFRWEMLSSGIRLCKLHQGQQGRGDKSEKWRLSMGTESLGAEGGKDISMCMEIFARNGDEGRSS